jgi:hypothetical protein
MELQALQNSPGFGGRECLIEGAGRVGRQVVLYDPDARGIMDIDFCRPPLGELDLAPRPMQTKRLTVPLRRSARLLISLAICLARDRMLEITRS